MIHAAPSAVSEKVELCWTRAIWRPLRGAVISFIGYTPRFVLVEGRRLVRRGEVVVSKYLSLHALLRHLPVSAQKENHIVGTSIDRQPISAPASLLLSFTLSHSLSAQLAKYHGRSTNPEGDPVSIQLPDAAE